jgi:predicted DNA-binding protein
MPTAPRAAGKDMARSNASTDKKAMQQVSLYLPIPLYERLKQMQDETDQSSMNDVVKNALKLYMVLVEEAKTGNDVFVLSKDGTKTKYPVFVR